MRKSYNRDIHETGIFTPRLGFFILEISWRLFFKIEIGILIKLSFVKDLKSTVTYVLSAIEECMEDISNYYAMNLREKSNIIFHNKSQIEGQIRLHRAFLDNNKQILPPNAKYSQEMSEQAKIPVQIKQIYYEFYN